MTFSGSWLCLLWPSLLLGVTASVLLIRRILKMGSVEFLEPAPRATTLARVWTPASAKTLVDNWFPIGTIRVQRQIRADFTLIPAYLIAGISATLLVFEAQPLRGTWVSEFRAAVLLLWVLTAVFDAGENLLLLRVLPPKREYGWQPLASALSGHKWLSFFLAGVLLAGALLALVVLLVMTL